MIKIIYILIALSLFLQADVINFYRVAVQNLQYDKVFTSYKKSATFSQDAIIQSRYADISLDASYSATKAKTLQNHFNTTDIAINDNFDVFNKKSYEIEAISLEIQKEKFLLASKKEQLFHALISMITLYNSSSLKINLNQKLYEEQSLLYNKLSLLQSHGAVSTLVLLRFKNTLTQLQTKIIRQKNKLLKMKKQLNLYAPNQTIPKLNATLTTTKEQFLSHNPQAEANELMADKALVQSQALKHNYYPELSAGVAYQFLDDPTAYGDNYSASIALHIPLNSSDFKESEALQVDALSQKSKTVALKIQRENEYISLTQDYQSAKEQLSILQTNLDDYKKSESTIKTAFLKQFVDFNSYLQVLTQTLQIQEQMIDLDAQAKQSATLVNAIASGFIYE